MTSEQELYALWESAAVTGAGFRCRCGRRLVVVSRGVRNTGAGPDYVDAVLAIDGELCVGPVEMHRVEDEWIAHGHHRDPAYHHVVLHVVEHGTGRLSMPTLEAAALREGAAVLNAVEIHGERSGAASMLLAELSWARLLRRAVGICRAEPAMPSRERVRRAFVRMMFDCLGYADNREPMMHVAGRLLAHEAGLAHATFDETAGLVFVAAGVRRDSAEAIMRPHISAQRLRSILNNCDLPPDGVHWRFDTRPANSPERRLWGAAMLLHALYRNRLFTRLGELVRSVSVRETVEALRCRLGRTTFVGDDRAREIVINALLPTTLAAGVLTGNHALIEGACRMYRAAPSLASNARVRDVERRLCAGERLVGAFWQQGAIEYHQRYLTVDRGNLSFVAEPVNPSGPRARRPGATH